MHMKKINPVVHFELPYDDDSRITNFYTKVFGWNTNAMWEDMDKYILVSTSENDEKWFPKEVGKINGGLFRRNKKLPEKQLSIVIAVDDINESIKKIKEAGGKIVGEPMDIPDYWIYLSFIDTEWNFVSMMQPKMNM